MRVRPAAGGGRAVELTPERVEGWMRRFGERHGGVAETCLAAERVWVTARDGAHAVVDVPFPPLPGDHGRYPGARLGALVEHLRVPRRLGLIAVRLGGHSVGVAEDGRVVVSATGRRHVHGRSAAGGWSQQRFARRREGQARQALSAAIANARRVLLPRVGELEAVMLAGDRRALDALRAEQTLAPVMALALDRVLDVREPRRTVLDEVAERSRMIEVVVRDAPDGAARPAT